MQLLTRAGLQGALAANPLFDLPNVQPATGSIHNLLFDLADAAPSPVRRAALSCTVVHLLHAECMAGQMCAKLHTPHLAPDYWAVKCFYPKLDSVLHRARQGTHLAGHIPRSLDSGIFPQVCLSHMRGADIKALAGLLWI